MVRKSEKPLKKFPKIVNSFCMAKNNAFTISGKIYSVKEILAISLNFHIGEGKC